jgi:hypothetical protein
MAFLPRQDSCLFIDQTHILAQHGSPMQPASPVFDPAAAAANNRLTR